jgi:DNA-binding response OmpR family regulator
MANILICDDEKDIVSALEIYLKSEGYEIFKAYNGEEALDVMANEEIHLVLLDVMMPKRDGISALTEMRKRGSNIPVLILSAKSEIDDKILGLDSGANDYLTKPFAVGELLARIRAMTRVGAGQNDSKMKCGNITLDLATYELTGPDGSFKLANKEFQMLEMLMRNPAHLISTERFMEKIWGYDSESEINVVWVYISYLRKKFSGIGANVSIRAHRNSGYSLEIE